MLHTAFYAIPQAVRFLYFFIKYLHELQCYIDGFRIYGAIWVIFSNLCAELSEIAQVPQVAKYAVKKRTSAWIGHGLHCQP